MPQDQEALEKELRRQMREGRAPLIQAVRDTYEPFLLAKKGWERKNAELREQVGLLNNQFSTKGKQLRESSRKSTDSGAGMVDLYKDLSRQAKAVSTLIDKELPNLVKLYEPVGALYTAYQQAMDAYSSYMAQWVGCLPESDLNGRALELAVQEIECSLR
jgi:hypothetical protein